MSHCDRDLWLAKPNVFTVWPFTEQVCRPWPEQRADQGSGCVLRASQEGDTRRARTSKEGVGISGNKWAGGTGQSQDPEVGELHFRKSALNAVLRRPRGGLCESFLVAQMTREASREGSPGSSRPSKWRSGWEGSGTPGEQPLLPSSATRSPRDAVGPVLPDRLIFQGKLAVWCS